MGSSDSNAARSPGEPPAKRARLGFVVAFLIVAVGAGGAAWWRFAPIDVDALLPQAIRAVERKDHETARTILEKILKRYPEHAQAVLYRAQLARDEGDPSLAMDLVRRIGEEPRKEAATARFLEGSLHLESGRAKAAETAFRKSIALNPNWLSPRERLLRILIVQERGPDVKRTLRELRELRQWTVQDLAVIHGADGLINRLETSEPQLRKFLESDPDDVDSAVALARHFLLDGKPDQAGEALDRVSAKHRGHPAVRAIRSERLLLQADVDGARAALGEQPPEPDDPAAVWRMHGLIAFERSEWKRAAELLREALARNPSDQKANYRLALALERSGQEDAAKRQFARTRLREQIALQAGHIFDQPPPRPAQILRILLDVGGWLLELGEPSEATPWYQQAVVLAPRDARGLAGLDRAMKAAQAKTLDSERPATSVGPSVARPAGAMPDTSEAAADSRSRPRPAGTALRTSATAGTIRLVDKQAEAGIDFRYFNGESGKEHIIESLGGGVAALDFDADGWPDLYFTQGCRLPWNSDDHAHTDRLYRNRGDGTFQDVTNAVGLGSNRYGQGCAAGDFDNDGFPDLAVATYGIVLLYRNNGDGTFSDATAESGIAGSRTHSSLAWSDLDRDGDLDLYVATYVPDALRVCHDATGRAVTCSPNSFEAEQDVLYRNDGDGRFADVTRDAGVVANEGKGLGVLVGDLDDDGWPDVYVANDGTPNFLFHNQTKIGGPIRLQEQGLASGAAVSEDGRSQAGMGIAAGDFNGDRLTDLYVTNFYHDYNTLYLNQGGLLFVDDTRRAGLVEPTLPYLGFGTQAADFDLDGALDLFVANGHITDLHKASGAWKMPPQLFRGRGDGRFDNVTKESGEFFRGAYLGRGAAKLDWNRDGKPDLVVVHQDRPVGILRNETASTGHFIRFDFRPARNPLVDWSSASPIPCGVRRPSPALRSGWAVEFRPVGPLNQRLS